MPPPPPSPAPKMIATAMPTSTQRSQNSKVVVAKKKTPPLGHTLHVTWHRGCGTPFQILAVPKTTTISSYYKEAVACQQGKTTPKTFKVIKVYIQEPSATLK